MRKTAEIDGKGRRVGKGGRFQKNTLRVIKIMSTEKDCLLDRSVHQK